MKTGETSELCHFTCFFKNIFVVVPLKYYLQIKLNFLSYDIRPQLRTLILYYTAQESITVLRMQTDSGDRSEAPLQLSACRVVGECAESDEFSSGDSNTLSWAAV